MGGIDRSKMKGQGKPKLDVDTFRELTANPKARRTVITVQSARSFTFEDGQTAVFVQTVEYPDHEIAFSNGEQKSALMLLVDANVLKDEQDADGNLAWEGVRLPLTVQVFKFKGKEHEKWVAVHPDDYDEALASFDKVVAGKK